MRAGDRLAAGRPKPAPGYRKTTSNGGPEPSWNQRGASAPQSARRGASALIFGASGRLRAPAWTTYNLPSPRSASATRMERVTAGAVVRLNSNPRRRPPRTTSRSNSALKRVTASDPRRSRKLTTYCARRPASEKR